MNEEDEFKNMFSKIVAEQVELQNMLGFEKSLEDFWKSVEDGSIFKNEELMQVAKKIVKKNPGIMDNF